MCAASVVSNAGWFPSVSCCSGRHSSSPNIIHPFLFPTGNRSQRTAPCSKPGFAGRDLSSDTYPSDKGITVSPISMNSVIPDGLHVSCPNTLNPSFWQCLAYLVANAPYHRLRPGLLSPLWKQMRPYMRHRGLQIFNLDHLNLLGSSANFNSHFIFYLCLMHTTVAIRKP